MPYCHSQGEVLRAEIAVPRRPSTEDENKNPPRIHLEHYKIRIGEMGHH